MVAVDLEKLNQVYADDWATVRSSGKLFRKENLLDDFKSGEYKLVSFELGPMNVQAFDNVAVVQAGVKEKRGSRTEKIIAVNLRLWISSRSVQASG